MSAQAKKQTYSDEIIHKARQLWVLGIPASQICEDLKLNNVRVLYQWRDKFGWDNNRPHKTVEEQIAARFNRLIDKPDVLTGQELQELDRLNDMLLKWTKLREQVVSQQAIGTGRPVGAKTGEGKPRKKKIKNDISELTQADFDQFYKDNLYPHQQVWIDAGRDPKTRDLRFILKSRKIGATWVFAVEALEDAVVNGHNQCFISATRAQAEVFKAYIFAIAKEYFNVELKGNPTELSNSATLYYLSTNHLSAQSYGGSVYWDEVFWTRNFTQLYDVSSPIASHDGHRKTLISTPSAISHEAYQKWTGKEYNEGREKKDHVQFSVSHSALKAGRLCEDGIWRQIVTLEDAVNSGFDRISIERMKRENAPAKYANFFGCQFVDDTHSVFSLSELLKCGKDPIIVKGWDKKADRPLGNKPCTVGYDPAGEGDNSSAVLMTLPRSYRDKFQLLDDENMVHIKAAAQAQRLKRWVDKYNVQHMEIDSTGPGLFVPDFIEPFFPMVKPVHYSPEYKTLMVQKAQAVIDANRFEYDARHTDIPLAFMTVKQGLTEKTKKITYFSTHSNEDVGDAGRKVGHGDKAWAIMHGFMAEQLNPEYGAMGVEVNIYD